MELKERWTDKALEDLAAFANTRGGTLLIGVRKSEEIVGTATEDAEIQRIANTIVSQLGITPSVKVQTLQGLNVIETVVKSRSCRVKGALLGKLRRFFPNVSAKTVQRDFQIREGLTESLGKKGGVMGWLDNGHIWATTDTFWTFAGHNVVATRRTEKRMGQSESSRDERI
ncbi:MAG: ATP-binding protein [Candidatus Bipolaricaulota bacterium]|nr:ATP-binding protein [Candidatus Bipolaricaulota bacterium]MDW8127457.1 ATP-binding protein [Candidatus Bipolaricaulota bacterium]